MRICFLANAASIHTQRWVTHFAQRGHEIFLLSLEEANLPGVTVIPMGRPHRKSRWEYLQALPAIRRALKSLSPDVLHAHYAGGYGLIGALAGYRPFILTAWGSDVLVVPHQSAILRFIVGHSLRRADLVTSVAQHMTAVIHELGVPEKQILTLPFGVNIGVFHPGISERDWSGGGPKLIVSTRHFEPIYNVGLLIEALPRIFAQVPEAAAVLVGAGSLRPALESRVAELGIQDRVQFAGRLPQSAIAELLSKAHVFVSTALSDGNNISLNEAMACGAFPVVTDIPANREWIRNGSTGFLVDTKRPEILAKRVITGLQNPGLCLAAAEENWATIQQRGSWDAAMLVMEKQYRELANSPAHVQSETNYLIYRLSPSVRPQPVLPEGYSFDSWQPSLTNLLPPTLDIRFFVFWLCHMLHIFPNRRYSAILIKHGTRVIHRTCLVPKFFRWPFMHSGDLSASSTWTHPEFRRLHLASLALEQAAYICAEENRALWYVTRQSNEPSIGVCVRTGFQLYAHAVRTWRWGVRSFGKIVPGAGANGGGV